MKKYAYETKITTNLCITEEHKYTYANFQFMENFVFSSEAKIVCKLGVVFYENKQKCLIHGVTTINYIGFYLADVGFIVGNLWVTRIYLEDEKIALGRNYDNLCIQCEICNTCNIPFAEHNVDKRSEKWPTFYDFTPEENKCLFNWCMVNVSYDAPLDIIDDLYTRYDYNDNRTNIDLHKYIFKIILQNKDRVEINEHKFSYSN